jgi:hypothetical protein
LSIIYKSNIKAVRENLIKSVPRNGPAYSSLYGTNCGDDGASLLDKLHTLLKASNVSSTSPSTSHDSETTDCVPFFTLEREAECGVSSTVCACYMKMFSVAYVSGVIAKRLLNNSNCDICKNVCYLKCHHRLISTYDSRSTAVQYSAVMTLNFNIVTTMIYRYCKGLQ